MSHPEGTSPPTTRSAPAAPASPGAPAPDPSTVLRSRAYLTLLVFAAVVGVPIAALAYGYLQLVGELQQWLLTDLPRSLGLGEPTWWPVPVLVTGGLLVALTIRFVPGRGGEIPADGFHSGGPPPPSHLLGIALASVITLGFGAVLGPEAPLIALGGGLAAWAVRLAKHDAPAQAIALIGAAGSFAAISTLLGLAARGRLPAPRGRRGRQRDDFADPGPGAAGGRDRVPGLRRPGLADRSGGHHPVHLRSAPGRRSHGRRSSAMRSSSAWPRPSSGPGSAGWACG